MIHGRETEHSSFFFFFHYVYSCMFLFFSPLLFSSTRRGVYSALSGFLDMPCSQVPPPAPPGTLSIAWMLRCGALTMVLLKPMLRRVRMALTPHQSNSTLLPIRYVPLPRTITPPPSLSTATNGYKGQPPKNGPPKIFVKRYSSCRYNERQLIDVTVVRRVRPRAGRLCDTTTH